MNECPSCGRSCPEGDAFCGSCGSPVGPVELCDLGLLLVHGIGAQSRGQTLVEFGEPIRQWIEDRWGEESRAAPRRVPSTTEPESSAVDPDRAPVSATDTRLHDSTDRAAPAHTTLALGGRGGERWLCAESWWAEQFAPPRYGDLFKWAWSILPWVLGSHFGAQIRRRWRERPWAQTEEQPQGEIAPDADKVSWYVSPWRVLAHTPWGLGLLAAWGRLFASLLLSVVVVPLLALFLVVAALPVPAVRSVLLRIQRGLSSVLGDSYVFLGRPIESASIVRQVRQDLTWLSRRCRAVAIIAHSQGGAVAHEAVRGDVPGNLRLLFTFGSGLRKLEELRQAMRRGATQRIMAVMTSVSTFFLAVLLSAMVSVVGTAGPSVIEWSHVLMLALFSAFTVAGVLQYLRGIDLPQLDRWMKSLEERGISWADCYACADPVPNGMVTPAAKDVSHAIHNRDSAFSDHTSYWENRDEFIGLLIRELSVATRGARPDDTALGSLALDEGLLDRVRRRRRYRVLVGRGAAFVGMLAIFAAIGRRWEDWWAFVAAGFWLVWGWLADLLRVEVTQPEARAVSWSAVGWLVLGLGTYWLATVGWRRWHRREMLWSIEGRTARWDSPSWAGVGIFFALVFAYAIFFGDSPPFWLFFGLFVVCSLPLIIGSTATEADTD